MILHQCDRCKAITENLSVKAFYCVYVAHGSDQRDYTELINETVFRAQPQAILCEACNTWLVAEIVK